MKDLIKNINKFNFTAFTKEKIEEQFKEIVETLTSSMGYKNLIKQFHKILHNRVTPLIKFDNDSPEFTIYRITTVYENFNPNNPDCYSYNPNPTENGRAHRAGYPVFYGALDPISAISEMKGRLDNGELFYISRWKIKFKTDISIHSLLINSNTINDEHVLNQATNSLHTKLKEMVKDIPAKYKEGYIYAIQKMGDLFTNPKDTLYHITSSYSYELLYEAKSKGLNVPIIVYPSVENNQNGVNWAIHPTFVDSNNMRLQDVFQLSIKENNINSQKPFVKVSFLKKARFFRGTIKTWQLPTHRLLEVEYKYITVKTYNSIILNGKKVFEIHMNNSKKTIKDLIKHSIDSNEVENNLHKLPFNQEGLDPLDFESKELKCDLFLQFKHGYEILTKDGLSSIQNISVPIRWIKEYINIK